MTLDMPVKNVALAPAHGAVGDLVVLDAGDVRGAFATRLPRRWVIRKGRLIAENRVATLHYFDLPAAPVT
jgi:cytosine deaminase